MAQSVNVKQVQVSGNERLRLSYFEGELSDVVTKSTSTDDLAEKLRLAYNRLHKTDLFESVKIDVVDYRDPALSGSHVQGDHEEDSLPVTVKVSVKEKNLTFLKMESYVRTANTPSGNMGCEVNGTLRSPFGYGELIQLTVGKSSAGSQQSAITASIPSIKMPFMAQAFPRLDMVMDLRAFNEDSSYFTSFHQRTNALTFDLEPRRGVSDLVSHKITLEAAVRDEIPSSYSSSTLSPLLSPLTSMSPFNLNSSGVPSNALNANSHVLQNATSSTKISAKYSFTHDSRNNAVAPSSGHLLQSTVEISLPPGSATFLRSEVSAQTHKVLGPPYLGQTGLTASICGSLGVIVPLASMLRSIFPLSSDSILSPSFPNTDSSQNVRPLIPHLSDRFHLGGPMALRGFDYHGIGNRVDHTTRSSFAAPSTDAVTFGSNLGEMGNAISGTSKASLLACLSVPLPIYSFAQSGGRAILFLNSGSLGSYDYWANRLYNISSPQNLTAAISGGGGNDSGGRHRVLHAPSTQQSSLFGFPRISIGCGITFSIAQQVRFEVTYAVPLLKSEHDVIKPFQLGIGISI